MSELDQGQSQSSKKWWGNALLIGAIVAVVALPLGAVGTKLGIWSFMGGFALLAVGVVLATMVFFLGIIAVVYANSKKMLAERKSALIGVALSAVVLALMGNQFMLAVSVPPIHNISTDTINPPQFDKIVALREASGANSLAYDADKLAPLQQQAYPYVKPLISSVSQTQMLTKVVSALQNMGLEIVDNNTSEGRVEATATTFWFGFKDDVVVRVRAESSGSVVDVRSVSRVGESDMGKNAQRISELLAALGG
ncbi:MAG: DUF1499 domain-containing protein [Gammaproteobacteria bacterium]|nr:DUF1499 domain-containing protein [Gammaproteobacteria bacterium]